MATDRHDPPDHAGGAITRCAYCKALAALFMRRTLARKRGPR